MRIFLRILDALGDVFARWRESDRGRDVPPPRRDDEVWDERERRRRDGR